MIHETYRISANILWLEFPLFFVLEQECSIVWTNEFWDQIVYYILELEPRCVEIHEFVRCIVIPVFESFKAIWWTNAYFRFRLNDNVSINNIIRNHNVDDIDKNIFKDAYKYATKDKFNFFLIDLNDKSKRLRHNFLEFLAI